MLPELEQYGKVVKKYEGTGELVGEDLHMPTSFQLAHYGHGKVYLRCVVSDPVIALPEAGYDADFVSPPPSLHFVGRTDQGYAIEATDLLQTAASSVDIPFMRAGEKPAEPALVTWQYRCEATLTAAHTTPPAYVVFSLVNLLLFANEAGWPVHVDGHHVRLRPVGTWRERDGVWRELRERGGRDVTYTAIIRMNPTDSLQEMQTIVDNLCVLLTLARGTPITWINYEAYSETDEFITSLLCDTVTKDFRKLDLFSEFEGQRLVEFVETAYPRLQACREQWRIDDVIATYVDSKAEQGFMELRALQLACCMEILTGKYLDRVGKATLVPDAVFGKIVKALLGVIRLAGYTVPDVLPQKKLQMMEDHLSGLNRYSFVEAIEDMCVEVKLFADDPTLLKQKARKFKNMRNDLVHRGQFPDNHGDGFEQYKFMDDLVGMFLVAALGYPASSLRPWTVRWATVPK